MINAGFVTCLDGVDELDEDLFDKSGVSPIRAFLRQELEEVPSVAIVQNQEKVGAFNDDSVKCENVPMPGDSAMELQLAGLKGVLAAASFRVDHALDGVLLRCDSIHGMEHDPARASAERSH